MVQPTVNSVFVGAAGSSVFGEHEVSAATHASAARPARIPPSKFMAPDPLRAAASAPLQYY
jgi:hypothetical protein